MFLTDLSSQYLNNAKTIHSVMTALRERSFNVDYIDEEISPFVKIKVLATIGFVMLILFQLGR